eukprot:scaffold9388_cov148-Skeletonema_marinoi.AAC.9
MVEMTAVNLVEVTADMMARMMARMMDWLSVGLKAQPKVEMLVASLAEETADMKEWRLDLQLVEVPCTVIPSATLGKRTTLALTKRIAKGDLMVGS